MKRLIALLGAVALFAGACGDDDSPAPRAQSGKEKPASEFTVTGTEYAFDAPDEVTGGVVTMKFENKGQLKHEAVLLSIGDTPVAQAVKDFGPVLEGGPFPAYLNASGGVGTVDAGKSGTSTFMLDEGNYIFICVLSDADSMENPEAAGDLPPHFQSGMVKALTVKGDNGRSLPAADGTIVARDYSFEIPPLSAGSKTLVFKNESAEQLHHVVLMEFPAGMDEAGAAKAFEAMASAGPDSPPPSGPMPEEIGGSAVFGPGLGGTFEAKFQAGRTYAALCFISDRAGGPPHAFGHQMVKFFTVS
jgi:hypothetical protein